MGGRGGVGVFCRGGRLRVERLIDGMGGEGKGGEGGGLQNARSHTEMSEMRG